MSEKPETVADVVAEMRASPVPSKHQKNDWADRIERALSAQGEAVHVATISDNGAGGKWTDWHVGVGEYYSRFPIGTKLYAGPAPRAAVDEAMVERAARGICQMRGDDPDEIYLRPPMQERPMLNWHRWKEHARAALTAALNPES